MPKEKYNPQPFGYRTFKYKKMTNKKDLKATPANKILTVVIPTYNMEKYLRRCLDSLIVSDRQMQMLEVLVINDGSKDTSSQIAHEYQDRYPHTFRVIDKENGNYGSCVNRGLDEATGKYFRLLDADDQFDKEGLVKVLQVLATTEADMVITPYTYTYEEGAIKAKPFPKPKGVEYGKIYRAEDFDYYEKNCKRLLCMHATTYKLSILKEVGLRHQTGISYTDTEYVYFPLVAVKTILPLDITLYIYTRGRDGQTVVMTGSPKQVNDYYLVSERIFYDFIKCEKNISDKALRRKQLIIMGRVVCSYYQCVLCYTKNNEAENQRMAKFANEIKKQSPDLYDLMRNKIKTRKILFGFRIWEKTGKYITDQPFKLVYDILGLIKGKKK